MFDSQISVQEIGFAGLDDQAQRRCCTMTIVADVDERDRVAKNCRNDRARSLVEIKRLYLWLVLSSNSMMIFMIEFID